MKRGGMLNCRLLVRLVIRGGTLAVPSQQQTWAKVNWNFSLSFAMCAARISKFPNGLQFMCECVRLWVYFEFQRFLQSHVFLFLPFPDRCVKARL